MINWTKASSWCRKRKRKKYPLLPHKTTQGLGVADFDGWGLVENVISLVFARFFSLFFSFSLWGFHSHITLGTRDCFSCATGSFVLSAEGRSHERRSFSRGSPFKTDWNRKPRMKSLWHPGYSHIRTMTIFGGIRMGVYTTPYIFGAGTETIPDTASVYT